MAMLVTLPAVAAMFGTMENTTANSDKKDAVAAQICLDASDPYSVIDARCDWFVPPDQALYPSGATSPQSVLTPIWVFLCTAGNGLNITLLKQMPASYRITFLMSIAVFDILVMWSYCISYFTVLEIKNFTSDASGEADRIWHASIVFRTVSIIATSCSDWILLVFNLSHLVSICLPLRSLTMCSRTRARVVIGVLVILATTTWGFSIVTVLVTASAQADSSGGDIWWTVWKHAQATGGMFAFLFTYFAILATSSVIVCVIMCAHPSQSQSHPSLQLIVPTFSRGRGMAVRRVSLAPTSSTSETISNAGVPLRVHVKKSKSMYAARMLIITSCADAVLKAPLVICFIIVQACLIQICDRRMQIAGQVAVTLYNANYSLHFFIYWLASPEYGKRVWRLITRKPLHSQTEVHSPVTATSSANTVTATTSV